jgi:GH24 family phage-related lysozyme (muramidase)
MLAAFNVGADGLLGKGHTLGDDIRAENCDHAPIAKEFGLYNHAGGQVDPALTTGRQTETALFNYGIYPNPKSYS